MSSERTLMEIEIGRVAKLRKELEVLNDKLYGEQADENEYQWEQLLSEKQVTTRNLDAARAHLRQLQISTSRSMNGATREITQYTDIHYPKNPTKNIGVIHGVSL